MGYITQPGGGGGSTLVDVQIFSTPGANIWTKPPGAKWVEIICIAGGSGGAGGVCDHANSGYGGGGGGISLLSLPATMLAATENLIVGSGSIGGLGQLGANRPGGPRAQTNSLRAGNSTFGNLLFSEGAAPTQNSGSTSPIYAFGTASAGDRWRSNAIADFNVTKFGPGSGGSGAEYSGGGTLYVGFPGNGSGLFVNPNLRDGAGGTSTPTLATRAGAGGNGTSYGDGIGGGGGGGGGGYTGVYTGFAGCYGGHGGNAGFPGGGGGGGGSGGGGASDVDTEGGNGGNGGGGQILVTSYL